MKSQSSIHLVMLTAVLLALFVCADLSAQTRIQGEKLDPSTYGPSRVESMQAAVERDLAVPRPLPPEWKERNGRQGAWKIPSRGAATAPHHGKQYAINEWGDTRMGIGFPGPVNVLGAYFAGQSGRGVWTAGIKVIGYRDGKKVKETGWFRDIANDPRWMAMNLEGVDRIEILSIPVYLGGGWYAMDDLTYAPAGNTPGKKTVVGFDDLNYRFKLTGSGYAGLTWETGTGDFADEGVHAPMAPPDKQVGEEASTLMIPKTTATGGTEPTLVQSFQGVIRGDAGSMSYPPDTDGAIGPNHYVETVNRNFAVYDKTTGTELVNILLGSFLPGSNGDPRVLFDHHSGRWIVLVTDFSASATHFLAVSMTDDPMGNWFKGSFLTAQGSDVGKWPDYPTLGVDADGIYTASYMVGSGSTMTIFAIDKAPLVAPIPQMGTITAFRQLPWEGAIQPAHTYGQPDGEYLVSWQSSSTLRVRRIDPPLTAPILNELGLVGIPSFSSPPDAPALGSTVPLDSVDDRLMMSVYRDGSLWSTHAIAGGAGAGCRWYEIDVASMALVQSGTVIDDSLYYIMPSIMVNQNGDAVMAFTGSDADQYAACYYTGRLAADPLGEMAPPVMYKAGTGPQNNIDSYGRNRWGDYSYTTLDPIDEATFYTIQEYGHGNNIWGTYVAVLDMIPPPLMLSLETEVPDRLDPGLAASFLVTIMNGTENYVPGSGQLLYRFDGGAFQAAALTALGNDLYEGVLPNTKPGDQPEFYFTAKGDKGSTMFLPKNAPAALFSFDVFFLHIVFEDDFETNSGWTVVNDPSLTTGAWERDVPQSTGAQPGQDHSVNGTKCYVTGPLAGSGIGSYDVDGGPTILTSPVFDLSDGDAQITYYRWYYNDDGADDFTVEVSNDNGAVWKVAEKIKGGGGGWNFHAFNVTDFVIPTANVKVRFSATDNPNNSITEGLLDDFVIWRIIDDAPFWADSYTIPASTGGVVNFSLDAGPNNAGRKYLLLGSVTGTEPGFVLPGGEVLPLNWDVFTDLIVQNLTLPSFQNFLGALDGLGTASAALNTFGPVDPGLVGVHLYFAYLLTSAPAFDFTSNAITVVLEP